MSTEDGLSNHTIFSMAKEKNGNIWMGSSDGINIYVPEQRKNYILPHDAMVECITQDNNDQIWIGSFKGAYKINRKEKTIEKIEVNPTNINQRTRDIFEDKQGCIWFGKNTDGINIYDPKTQKTKCLNKSNGLIENKVTRIVEDKNGKIWIGTLGGGISI